jgi:hypothetical protein
MNCSSHLAGYYWGERSLVLLISVPFRLLPRPSYMSRLHNNLPKAHSNNNIPHSVHIYPIPPESCNLLGSMEQNTLWSAGSRSAIQNNSRIWVTRMFFDELQLLNNWLCPESQ